MVYVSTYIVTGMMDRGWIDVGMLLNWNQTDK
jgi:hypothetical protein